MQDGRATGVARLVVVTSAAVPGLHQLREMHANPDAYATRRLHGHLDRL